MSLQPPIDEDQADDGAIHRLFQTVPLERIQRVLFLLVVLARFRGTVPDDVRARAQELASQPDFNLAFHPVIQRILEAP